MKILVIASAVFILLLILVLLFLRHRGATTKFISEQQMQIELAKDLKLSETILGKLNLTTAEWKFDYSFFTNKQYKALALIHELEAMGYSAHLRQNNLLWVIEEWQVYGWTNNIDCDSEAIKQWIERMYKMGYECDCAFERWGSFDSQNLIEDAIKSGDYISSVIEKAKQR